MDETNKDFVDNKNENLPKAYECLYTVAGNKFVAAKEIGWEWGISELDTTVFTIQIEELTDDQLEAKIPPIAIPQNIQDAMKKAQDAINNLPKPPVTPVN